MNKQTESKLLTTAQAASILNLKRSTLDTWRCTRSVEVPYIKIGHSIRYRQEDLTKFIKSNLTI